MDCALSDVRIQSLRHTLASHGAMCEKPFAHGLEAACPRRCGWDFTAVAALPLNSEQFDTDGFVVGRVFSGVDTGMDQPLAFHDITGALILKQIDQRFRPRRTRAGKREEIAEIAQRVEHLAEALLHDILKLQMAEDIRKR